MTHVTLYHNPRCSKSRQALSLLQENGADIQEVRYLDEPLSATQLKRLFTQLGLTRAHDILRVKEPEYKEAGLTTNSDDETVIEAIIAHPKLLERPIAVVGDRAIVGRPPENVLELL